jgi:nickel-dependent lactate racemase
MLGRDMLDAVAVVNHDAEDSSALTWMGTYGDGVPVWLNRRWVEADVRITTGYVEPHFFAGFSGGPKLVAPGLAGLETTLVLHDARRIAHPAARWGITEGNPVHDDIRAVAAGTGVDFALDVVLDGHQQVVQAFAGELFAMHRAACNLSKASAMRAVDAPFEVVVTSNAGFPLDQNLYQAVKGMSAAAQVVRPGGTIVCAAECRDGFPDHGSYRAELEREPTPADLARSIERRLATQRDQWQVQVQANVLRHAEVIMHTSFLAPADLARAHLGYADDIGTTVYEALDREGPNARVCVLPEGPITIPYVA